MPQSPPTPQLDLAMQPPPLNPKSDSALRAAFEQLHLDRKMTFDAAMQNRSFEICIRGKALAAARRIQQKAPA